MAEDAAIIRTYDRAQDDKLVRFMIGKAHMEPLAAANRQACMHPLYLAIWIGISSAFIQIMGWWPRDEYGVMGYLSPLPAFAASAVPLMFLMDWLNRPYFEEDTMQVLARPDVVDVQSYYSRSPVSGFWILEYGTKFVGFISMDASPDSLSEQKLADRSPSKNNTVKSTSKVATIRHFYVSESYRPVSIQSDLLRFAVDHAFNTGSTVEKIRAVTSPLTPYIGRALRDAGFGLVEKGPKMGVFGWRTTNFELTREQWAARVRT